MLVRRVERQRRSHGATKPRRDVEKRRNGIRVGSGSDRFIRTRNCRAAQRFSPGAPGQVRTPGSAGGGMRSVFPIPDQKSLSYCKKNEKKKKKRLDATTRFC